MTAYSVKKSVFAATGSPDIIDFNRCTKLTKLNLANQNIHIKMTMSLKCTTVFAYAEGQSTCLPTRPRPHFPPVYALSLIRERLVCVRFTVFPEAEPRSAVTRGLG